MKKLIAIFAAVFTVGVSVNAAAIVGIPWDCKELAAAQQLAASTPADASDAAKSRNTIMLAYLTNPVDFDTFAKAEAKVIEVCPTLSAAARFDSLANLCVGQKTLNYGEALAADSRKLNSIPYLVHIGDKAEFAGKSNTIEERKNNLKAGVQRCLLVGSAFAAAKCRRALRIYIELTAADDNAVVVPFLQEVYRKALPKVSVSDAWKPIAVTAGLALKARGINVE